MSRYLFLAGALPFLVLGIAHVLATPLAPDRARGLSPADPGLAEAMARTALRLTRRTDMWKAWVGFNLSHGLGIVLFAVVVLVVGRSPEAFLRDAGTFVPLATITAAAYLGLAVKYWFRTPIVGCAVATALFLSSWILLP